MIEYEVLEEDYGDFDFGRLIRLEEEIVIDGESKTDFVLAYGGTMDRKTGIFDPYGEELIVEGIDDESAIEALIKISENLELRYQSITE